MIATLWNQSEIENCNFKYLFSII